MNCSVAIVVGGGVDDVVVVVVVVVVFVAAMDEIPSLDDAKDSIDPTEED
jgi:hypothetical protein